MGIWAGFGSDQLGAKGTEHFLPQVCGSLHTSLQVWGEFWATSRTFPALLPRSRKNGTTAYKLLPAEAVFANTLGLFILIFGVLVVAALARPSWKRPDSDSPDSRQVWDALGGLGKPDWEAAPQHSPKGGDGLRDPGSSLSPTAPALRRALIPGICQHSSCLHVPAPAWIPGHAKPQCFPVPSLIAAAGAARASLG